MNQTGKYIVYLLFGLLTAAAFISSCTDANEPGDITPPKDKISLSISFQSEQQLRAENGLKANEGGEIDAGVYERESAVYSLAVFVFDGNKLDGSKFINRELKAGTEATDSSYVELDKITGIELTAGVRDVYIIANAPDAEDGGYFSNVTDFNSFKAKMEELSRQKIYGHDRGATTDPDGPPIGGVDPNDRFTNLVMSQSFKDLPLNSGAPKHYLGYTGGVPAGESGTLVNGYNPVELVRLMARVAIQKIEFELPDPLTIDGQSIDKDNYSYLLDGVFMINAKKQSSYFPEVVGFQSPAGSFGHGSNEGFDYLKTYTKIDNGNTYQKYLYIPLPFKEYDIKEDIDEQGYAPLWFYAFENNDSETSPTCLVIGVNYQYRDITNSGSIKAKKIYYPVVVNRNGATSAGHAFIKRNNQYGIKVKIKGLSEDYPDLKSVTVRAMNDLLDTEGIVEITEEVGSYLFPWTGNVYQ
ncbi:fimbrial protein [Proteiniphilum sp. UBA5384]|uniref:fimbrial protein n=1 Tax=Proteiniphilum sp. UBA5384 TaxID=1947279 RepID=UPI0025CDB429|nr:fimbrial protein [Proteiniphilum sp. UBA5384]